MMDATDHVGTRIDAGLVRGRWRTAADGSGARSAAFLGIPFAQPPVGALRFAAPEPVTPWSGVRDALTFGATAQRGVLGETLIPEPSVPGESTLNVNVFTPDPQAHGLPVLVWIHGGGFFAGSPASPWYDGRAFARDGVVTVTISYRLGFDGFGWIDGAPSNRGVRDWLAALEWVQRNIAAFGGAPDEVTIAGQSAGGGAVLTLLAMPAAQHLFRRAWALSGALGDVSEARARAAAVRIAAAAGVTPDRAGFASVDEQRLLELQKPVTALTPATIGDTIAHGLALGPAIDGDLLPRPTIDALRAGVGSDKELVLGATDDEFTPAAMSIPAVRWLPRTFAFRALGLRGDRRCAYVRANSDIARLGTARIAGRLLSDRMFRARVVDIAEARGAAPTWVYRFAWPSGSIGVAGHCLDVPFFFDCLDGPGIERLAGSHPPHSLAAAMHADVVAFASTGAARWPRWTEARAARVYDVPVGDEQDAYASVAALR